LIDSGKIDSYEKLDAVKADCEAKQRNSKYDNDQH
jgi:hypothetical protein